MPRSRLEHRPLTQQRTAEARLAFDPTEVEAADIAHPVAVHVGIEPRRHANQPRTARPLGLGFQPRAGVAPLRAERADRVHHAGVVPRPALEPVLPRGDRTHRTDVHEVAGQQRVHALFAERRDFAAVAAIDDADLRVAVDLAHESHTPRAQDAAVAVQHEGRTEIHVGLDAFAVEHSPREVHPARRRPEGIREVLKRALAALVAHRAVERVIDEQELEDAGARGRRFGVAGRDDHAVRADRRARGLQLRHLLDLHDADAAGPVDRQPGMKTVVGHRDAGFDGRLQHGLALGDRDLLAVDGQRDRIHK